MVGLYRKSSNIDPEGLNAFKPLEALNTGQGAVIETFCSFR